MITNLSNPINGASLQPNQSQMSPDFSVVDWEYFEWGGNNNTTIFSKAIYPYNERIVNIYNQFIDTLKINFPELDYIFGDNQYTRYLTSGRLRLGIVIDSEELAKAFEPVILKLRSSNFIRNALNVPALETVAFCKSLNLAERFHYPNLIFQDYETFFLNVIQNLINLTNDYDTYKYNYLDTLRLIKENMIAISNGSHSYEDVNRTFLTLIKPIFKDKYFFKAKTCIKIPDSLIKLKENFLAKCIFSGFLCIRTTELKSNIPLLIQIYGDNDPYSCLPRLLKIRNDLFIQLYEKSIDEMKLFPIVLSQLICDYLKDENQICKQLPIFFDNMSIDELIPIVDACSLIKSQEDEKEAKKSN